MRNDYGVHLGKKGKGSRGQTKSVEMSIARKMPKGRPSGDRGKCGQGFMYE